MQLPSFVKCYVTGYDFRSLHFERIAKNVFALSGSKRALIVWAERPSSAREKMRDFVAISLDPRTDKRRKRWFYT